MEIAWEILGRLSLPDTIIEFVGDRPGHTFRYFLDCMKIHCLSWKPEVSFEMGIQKTIDCYTRNR